MINGNMKVCSRCGMEKPVSEFYRKQGSKDGLHSGCKECHKASVRESRNRDQHLAYNRRWRREHSEHLAKYKRQYFKENYSVDISRRYRKRYPEVARAHQAIAHAVQSGNIPPASSLICEYCGEALAAHYHHHLGYSEEHVLDVVALCRECHGKEHQT